MALLVAAMGAAQLAIISKQKYQGGSSGDESTPMQALNIGRRNNAAQALGNPTCPCAENGSRRPIGGGNRS